MRFAVRFLAVFCSGIAATSIVSAGASAASEAVYVWQRQWSAAVSKTVLTRGTAFGELDILAAELRFGESSAIQSDIDWQTLHQTARPIGLVVRIEHYSGSAAASTAATRQVVQSCQSALAHANRSGIAPLELQIDCDCASSQLGAYADLLRIIRTEVAPPRLVITALPDWLRYPGFRSLADLVDGYVLQVHSVERPDGLGSVTLCDSGRAIGWIKQAIALNRPFRVALPDYGYRMGFDAGGKLVGLEAEGANRVWPVGVQIRTIMAGPTAVAAVVRYIQSRSDPALTGIAWFRLPIPSDDLVWQWATLEAVRRGESPSASLRLALATAEDGAQDLIVTNNGNGPGVPAALTLPQQSARPIGWDLIPGWRTAADATGLLQVVPIEAAAGEPLQPGESRRIGWIRYADAGAVNSSPLFP